MELTLQIFQGKRTGSAFLNRALWEKTSQKDRAILLNHLANTRYQSLLVEGRTLLVQLKEPVINKDGARIQSLRIKGIAPDVFRKGEIPQHRGAGFVPSPIFVDENGVIQTGKITRGFPEGGMFEGTALDEFNIAADRGPEICDFAFGYGSYPALTYEYEDRTRKLGFVIFGHESQQDLRLETMRIRHFKGPKHALEHLEERIAFLFGEACAGFHGLLNGQFREGYIHQHLHVGNIGILWDKKRDEIKVKVRDLETAMLLSSLTPPQRYGYLLLDFMRADGVVASLELCFPSSSEGKRTAFWNGYFGKPFPFIHEQICPGNRLFGMLMEYLGRDLTSEKSIEALKILSGYDDPLLQYIHKYLAERAGLEWKASGVT